MKVGLVARGKPLEIVTNTASKRKTEMAINFNRGERNFGSDAYALVSRKPQQTFTKITTMLGRHPDHLALKSILEHLPNAVSFNETRGGIEVELKDKDEDTTFTPEELVAMILGQAQVILLSQA
ncbi:unnamed protein product [Choristocarpus tenellus]